MLHNSDRIVCLSKITAGPGPDQDLTGLRSWSEKRLAEDVGRPDHHTENTKSKGFF